MRDKKGSGMTVNKLITIILVIAFLVLMVVAINSGLSPLFEKIGGKANEVLLLLHIKDSPGDESCELPVPVLNFEEESASLFEVIKVGQNIQESSVFTVCMSGECTLDLASYGKYRFREGAFEEAKEGDEWASLDRYVFTTSTTLADMEKDSLEAKRNWEMYNAVMDLLETKLTKGFLDEAYLKLTTKQFELYGAPSGIYDSEKHFIWENGKWKMHVGDNEEEYTFDDSEAINKFYNQVTSWWDDKVYTSVRIPKTSTWVYQEGQGYLENPIDKIVGGSNGKLNSLEEKEKLLSDFKTKKESYYKEATLSDEQIAKFKNLSGESISAGGKNYIMTVSVPDRFPVIALDGGQDKVWIVYDNDVKNQSKIITNGNFTKLRDYPLKLSSSEPNYTVVAESYEDKVAALNKEKEVADVGDFPADTFKQSIKESIRQDPRYYPNEEFYKLPKDVFDKAYEINKIKWFIHSRCI